MTEQDKKDIMDALNFMTKAIEKEQIDNVPIPDDWFEKHDAKVRADGYRKAENDYFAKTQKDKEAAFKLGYEAGRTFAINLILKILDKSFVLGMCEYEVIERIEKLKEQKDDTQRID